MAHKVSGIMGSNLTHFSSTNYLVWFSKSCLFSKSFLYHRKQRFFLNNHSCYSNPLLARIYIFILVAIFMFIWYFVFFSDDIVDRTLLHAVESVIIDWTHQIQSVLKRDSSQPLLEGLNPLPFTELNFWKARATNLECIFEQVKFSW